jgi:hypothetical protein
VGRFRVAGAAIEAIKIYAIVQGVDVRVGFTTGRVEIDAILAIFISAASDFGAALLVEANIASVSGVFALDYDDSLAVRRAARTSGASRGRRRILAARCNEQTDHGKERNSDNNGSHGCP